MKHILQTSILFLNVTFILGANILVFLPFALNSHSRAYKPLFKELAMRGHNVTFYTIQPFSENIPNLKQVVVKSIVNDLIRETHSEDPKCVIGWKHIFHIWYLGIEGTERLLKEPLIQELFKSTNLSFDVILMETFFIHEAFTALGHKFNAPIINLHPFKADEWINNILRNPQPLSYTPSYRLPHTEHMNFYQRMVNTIFNIIQAVTGHYYYIPTLEKLMKKYINYNGSENLPSLLEMMKNTSLTFLDGNHIVAFPSPNIPNFISVGGIHILPNEKQPDSLKGLQQYMDESPNGFVYMSFGSTINTSNLPSEKLDIFTKVLSNLPQRVLLKWDSNTKIPGEPKNILTSKWLPQLEILAHPKCRVFITHGGLHSVLEAAYFGVPIVGIPMIVDQESNLVMAKSKGLGQYIRIEDLNFDDFSSAVQTVLNEPSYKMKAETLSKLIKDVPMTPLETAVYWVEHVIRHKGAPHLQVAGINMPWYQYYLLDVIFGMISIYIIAILVLYKVVYTIYRIIFTIFSDNYYKVNKKIINKNKND